MVKDKYEIELDRLLKKHGLIITLLQILDADINVRRELERLNDISFQMRPSVEVERTREKWQRHLREVKQDIKGMVVIIAKQQAANE